MKILAIFIFLGVTAQLEASVLQMGVNLSDADVGPVTHKRVTRGADPTSSPAKEDSIQPEKEVKDTVSHGRRHLHGEPEPGNAENKVLALGLDTGAPAQSKNGIVQAISDAFGGLLKRPHMGAQRSRGRGYKYSDEEKKPLALELKSESLLESLERFLASPKIRKITNDLARKVAVIYRAIEKEL